jgi:hypothetical protein
MLAMPNRVPNVGPIRAMTIRRGACTTPRPNATKALGPPELPSVHHRWTELKDTRAPLFFSPASKRRARRSR